MKITAIVFLALLSFSLFFGCLNGGVPPGSREELDCNNKTTISEKTFVSCENLRKNYTYSILHYKFDQVTKTCNIESEEEKNEFETVECCNNIDCDSGNCTEYRCVEEEEKPVDTTYKCSKICEVDEFCNNIGQCEKVAINNTNYCGNFICEHGESADGYAMSFEKGITNQNCFLDCSSPCKSQYCNDKVEVQCGCSEYSVLATRHGCIQNALPCSDCSNQEGLFPEVLSMQTEVYTCLVDYFKFKPPKLIYKVFNNPNLDSCKNSEGCGGIEGGSGGADYVMFHNLNGFREFGAVVPTKPEHLTADVHETAHYFIYHMLHGMPSWFHEVVAIQTNERLVCSGKQTPWGDNYLPENEGQGGINMDDGTTLNEDYYVRLKSGETALSPEEQDEPHVLGTLFIIGLKKDYNCGFYCIRDIVLKLHEYELKGCAIGKCGVASYVENKYSMMWLGGEGKDEANERIEEATSEVVGADTGQLFQLLKLHETSH
jgi:hypothetical protein